MKTRRHEAGVSLTELMIAAALIGIGVLGAIASFNLISRSIQSSKSRSLATNLSQEKMQIIMQKSYYEILVTTAPAYNTQTGASIAYDPYYFAPEILTEGSIAFTRLTNIVPVVSNSGVITVITDPTTPDTGMRQITVSTLWQSGNDTHVVSIQNIINNPNTVMSDVQVDGIVTDAATHTPIPSALVDVAENVGWQNNADSFGHYLIHMSPGTFDFIASAPGYFQQKQTLSIAPAGMASLPFSLTAISTGTISGSVWVNKHLVISQVVPTTGTTGEFEYVELYNPTTYSIFIGSNSVVNTPSVPVIVWDQNNNYPGSGSTVMRHLYYVNSWVPSQGFYLITNSGTPSGTSTACLPFAVSGTTYLPDACWQKVQSPAHAFIQGDAGGFSIATTNSYSGTITNFVLASWPSARTDSVAWSDTAAGRSAPSHAVEGTGINIPTGPGPGEEFVRKSSTGGVSIGLSNAYDANNNSTDFSDFGSILEPPRTSTYPAQVPLSGTPAVGTVLSATDGVSASSTATLVGNPPYAQFTIPGVATGTWSVFADSSGASAEIDNVVVTATTTIQIPNATTTPPWPAANNYAINLSTTGIMGIISGVITDVSGIVISPAVNVSVGGVVRTVSPTGYYSIRLATGTYDVIANPGNGNAAYESQTRTGVTINLGDVTTNLPFRLSQGGKIDGWVTRDGVNPLPGVMVTAADSSGLVHDTEVSANNGRFTLINLTTATYTVQPVLDPKEIASPTNFSTTIAVAGNTYWSSSFTILGAMGSVTGSVSSAGEPIQTGVLIVVSTSSVSMPLAALSTATLTTGAIYADSSHEDGTYSVDVRGSTTTTYNVYAFYQHLNGQTPVISTSSLTGVTVTAGTPTTGENFSW